MSRSRDIGTVGESAVVRFLRSHGWPHAERRALAGAVDLGDITGTPGVVWEVKSGRTAEQAGDGLVADWLAETDTERQHAGADVGILITKRAGYGPARAASWWAHVDGGTAAALLGAHRPLPADVAAVPLRLHLSTAVSLLRGAGYGDPLPDVDEEAVA
ncbi:hypothetical protein GCM10009799_20380 [Nocardiopsis rhodophaea]|uniref:Holliday junction resolvase n=1 Tax=Nocardiopsis rhodophaea TaxID=280238 RepID=A0ABN2SXC0_9ACTN